MPVLGIDEVGGGGGGAICIGWEGDIRMPFLGCIAGGALLAQFLRVVDLY